jgi:hypothetical protein
MAGGVLHGLKGVLPSAQTFAAREDFGREAGQDLAARRKARGTRLCPGVGDGFREIGTECPQIPDSGFWILTSGFWILTSLFAAKPHCAT